MWDSMEELLAAISGEYGEDDQQQALAFAEESGLLDQWIADEDAEASDNYEAALEDEFQRVEQQVGRKLTVDEEQQMIDSISPVHVQQGTVPDWVREYGESLAATRSTNDGRVHLGAAAAERAMAEQGTPFDGGPQDTHTGHLQRAEPEIDDAYFYDDGGYE